LSCGDDVTHELSDAEVNGLRMDCVYADPSTDRQAIMSAMAKTATARQKWIKSENPFITVVLEQYPRMEDMTFDMVYTNAHCIYRCKKTQSFYIFL